MQEKNDKNEMYEKQMKITSHVKLQHEKDINMNNDISMNLLSLSAQCFPELSGLSSLLQSHHFPTTGACEH